MKKILIIAGSCNSGTAGLQADIKTCAKLNCYSATAVTSLVAETTDAIKSVVCLEPSFVKDQLNTLAEEFSFDAIKIGMLFSEEIMEVVHEFLLNQNTKVVLDPVCVSKSGHKLIKDSAVSKLKELMSLATIATPNLDEANVLFEGNFKELPCDIIVKKRVSEGSSIDTLYRKDGLLQIFKTPLIDPLIMSGTGCSFSTALACFLAKGKSLEESIQLSKEYICSIIKDSIDTKLGKNRLLWHGAK
ncbi:hydroxymethylpyrimidine/phosphomethylpyrimidine kinase [Campylobacter sp.]|uniref:hydroxymethylpyrimidine/phosphomethylpyrimidine kinase n=1 Tax=Campylobacter sp. TaxID=205 RepID=UPI003FA03774